MPSLAVRAWGLLALATAGVPHSGVVAASVAFHVERVTGPEGVGNGQGPSNQVEVWGGQAGDFDPKMWTADRIHWIGDVRHPLLAPKQAGPFRNIYSASLVEEAWGWRIIYSGWDGRESANDRLYAGDTKDFIDIDNRHLIVDHGDFNHVSNAVVRNASPASLIVLGTAAITVPGEFFNTNKPVAFALSDSIIGDSAAVPYSAKRTDIIRIVGYPNYERADLNGANAFTVTDGIVRFYFSDWHNPGSIFLAEGDSMKSLTFRKAVLQTELAANDVIRLTNAGKATFLMGLYRKGDVGLSARGSEGLWYSESPDGSAFGRERVLFTAIGPQDRFIFSMAFVTRGNSVLGVLYGAGADSDDSHNRIFARWIQKRLVLRAGEGLEAGNGAEYEAEGAIGPNRQVFSLPRGQPFEGEMVMYGDDGATLMGRSPVSLKPGAIYRIVFDAAARATSDSARH